MNPAIKTALDNVLAEEKRLQAEARRLAAELDKLRAVRVVLEQHGRNGHVPPTTTSPRKLAPPGLLDAKILAVLDRRHPKGNTAIREAIRALPGGYAYALTPHHVTKHLTKLRAARKVRQIGQKKLAEYVLVA